MAHSEVRVGLIANAIGFEVYRHGRRTYFKDGVEMIDVSEAEAGICRVAAVRVLDHLEEAGYVITKRDDE